VSGLTSLPVRLVGLTELEEFDLVGCKHMEALPERLGDLTVLEYLNLRGCSGLMLPERGT